MGITKRKWMEEQENNPQNWYTKKCRYCGESYRVNRITKPDPDPTLSYCFDCYGRVILEVDD